MDQLNLPPPLNEDGVRDVVMETAFSTVNREAEEETFAPAAATGEQNSPNPDIKFNDSPISRTDSSDSMNSDVTSSQKLRMIKQSIPENMKVRMSTRISRSGRASPVTMDEFKSLLPAGPSQSHDFRGVDQINGLHQSDLSDLVNIATFLCVLEFP